MFHQKNDGLPRIKTTESCSFSRSSKIQVAWELTCPQSQS